MATSEVDIANRALSAGGARSTISSFAEDSPEARQSALLYEPTRNQLLRMAPWNCAMNWATLALLKAAPGTPENPTTSSSVWTKDFPPPPWAYEYAYPSDCLDAQWIIPQVPTSLQDGVPIFPQVASFTPYYWNGPPVSFKVAIDQDDSGADIRVILANQAQAILAYTKRVSDPNVWDDLFQEALVNALAGKFAFALTGDKQLANMRIGLANTSIKDARAGDGNEGLTVNDVTPDWIRIRGYNGPEPYWNSSVGAPFDWGPLLSLYS